MCTELILALIYFFTIFIANYFFFNLIKKIFKNILFLQKAEKIFSFFQKKKKKSSFYFFLFLKKNIQKIRLISIFNKNLKFFDYLIIGHSYRFLQKNLLINFQDIDNKIDLNKNFSVDKEISQIKANNLYFRLLETQYLHFH